MACTMPTNSPVGEPSIGSRVCPLDATTSSISDRGCLRSTVTTSDLGTITDAVVCRPRSSTPVRSSCSNVSIRPSSREASSRAVSSGTPTARSISSTGVRPKGHTAHVARRSTTRMAGRSKATNAPWVRTVHRSVRSGSAMATFLGTSSPNSIWNTAARPMTRTRATVDDTPEGSPAAWVIDSIRRPIVGSTRTPRAMLLTVMPNCAPDIWTLRSRRATSARAADPEPSAAAASRLEGRAATRANSVATNRAFTATRATTASSGRTIMPTPRSRAERRYATWRSDDRRPPPPRSSNPRVPPLP